MKKSYPIIAGTIILTATGFISRIIGFFNRIFLSHTFGVEGMGIYQLISPIMALSFSFTAAGIQTAISKYVASETTTHDYKSSVRILLVGIVISLSLSLTSGFFIYEYSEYIATNILLESRTASLIRIISLSIPFGALHACINGYFYGIKNAKIPAATQLVEQLIRVFSCYFIYAAFTSMGYRVTINLAVIGIVLGECAAMIVSIIAIYFRFYRLHIPLLITNKRKALCSAKQIMWLATPLMANRLIINFLQSVESIYIPNKLQDYGLSVSSALSVYGVLTGMALPLILFPSAITNSMAVMLLPTVSEEDAKGNTKRISSMIHKSITYCLLLGFLCTAFFFVFGRFLGTLLFGNDMAGSYIIGLSFICPFLYLTTTLTSIQHGLGQTLKPFLFMLISLSIRLCFTFFAIPAVGIQGYLWGLLLSQLILAGCNLGALKKYL